MEGGTVTLWRIDELDLLRRDTLDLMIAADNDGCLQVRQQLAEAVSAMTRAMWFVKELEFRE
jgi:hypothetical protein